MSLLLDVCFFLPAGLANVAPVLANKIPGLNKWQTPLDNGKSYRGKRIFGEHKTWRGLMSGTLLGGVTALLVTAHYPEIYGLHPAFLVGAALGFGALLGDAIESFFKRRAHVPAGHSWFPFDQTDYIIGGLLLSLPLVRLRGVDYLIILVLYFGLHLVVSYLGYLLHFKERPI
jgi:CDP-2,3-bis-(O-geranylgeranyl)-sn-glycerol synthase